MAQLPLNVRKNLRDYEPKLKENLEKIKTATGRDFTLDMDVAAFNTVTAERGYENRVGECMYEWSLGGFADNIVSKLADPMAKEAFNAQVTNPQIKFILDENAKGYGEVRLVGGQLQVAWRKDNVCSNVSDIGSDLLDLFTHSGLPLKTAINLRENDSKLKENLAKLKSATGRDWTLDFDKVAFDKQVAVRGYEFRLGECVYEWMLGGLADNIVSYCKDDMVKEAINDAVKNTSIHFVLNEGASGYGEAKIEGGRLVIPFRPDSLCSNVSDIGNNIQSIL